MAPRDRIEKHSKEALAELAATRDYYEHTIYAWSIFRESSENGLARGIKVSSTGMEVGAAELADLGDRYISTYLIESVFQHSVSIFEDFVFNLIGCWLSAHPRSLGGDPSDRSEKTVPLDLVLDADDKDAILRAVVERELDRLKYQRPSAGSPTSTVGPGSASHRRSRSPDSPRSRPPATCWPTTGGSSTRRTLTRPGRSRDTRSAIAWKCASLT